MNTTTQPKESAAPPVVVPFDLRDYFAAKAMQGLLAQSNGTALGSPVEVAAAYAWAMADAMLAARADSLNSGPKPEQA